MMLITQKNVKSNTLQFLLYNTALRPEKIFPAFADHNTGALTNCLSGRRIAIIEKAIIIMKMKTSKTVYIIQKVRWSLGKVTFSMLWLKHLPNVEV